MNKIFSVVGAALLLATTSQMAQAADAEAGKKVFNKCSVCHSVEPDKVKVGPSLFGVIGRKAGTLYPDSITQQR